MGTSDNLTQGRKKEEMSRLSRFLDGATGQVKMCFTEMGKTGSHRLKWQE